MDIKTHCPECKAEFLTELSEPFLTELELQRRTPEVEAKLAEVAKLEEENANLKEEIAHLESEEHTHEVIAYWLNQDFEDADPVIKAELGRKLGLTKMFEEAKVAEVKEPAPLAGVVWQDPHDEAYHKVKNLPIWVRREGLK